MADYESMRLRKQMDEGLDFDSLSPEQVERLARDAFHRRTFNFSQCVRRTVNDIELFVERKDRYPNTPVDPLKNHIQKYREESLRVRELYGMDTSQCDAYITQVIQNSGLELEEPAEART